MSTISVDVSSTRIPVLQVGHQNENEVTDVLFNISAWITEYGSGTAQLRVKRPQNSEEESYSLSLPITDGVATWTVSMLDTANKGNGKVQLSYLVGSAVKESVVYPYKVGKSIVGADSPVDPFDSWIEQSKKWAIGKDLDDEDVPATDETYHNNSKYYMEQTAAQLEVADGIVDEATEQADLAKAYAAQFVGAPRAAASASAMSDTSKIYVYTGTTTSSLTNGHWYYHNGSAWADGGVYNSTALSTDTTLTVSGAAADSKKVGDEIFDLKEDIDELQETVFKEITYTFTNDASVTSGSSIKESEVNVACNIPAGTTYSVKIITSGTLFNKTSIIARRLGDVEDSSKYNCVANTKYTMTATGNVVRIGLYSGSGDVVGSGTLTIQVEYVVTNADSIQEQVETLTSEVSSIDSFIGTIPMESHVYDLSTVTEYNGKTQTVVGSTISMETSSTWYYKKVNCEGFALVTITELVSANPAPYHTYVFTDASDKVLAVDDGSHGSVIEYITYADVSVPANAKYLYMFSYSQSNTISLSYKTAQNVGAELVSISEETLARDKARFDDRFLYVAYSTVSGSGCSINTKEHFIWCAENGFNSIKGDVRPTSDGKLVMCHDAGFTLNGSGDVIAYDSQDNTPIHSLTYAQCTALKHANTGQYVCGIDDFLYVCKKYGLVAYITVRDEYVSEIVDATFEALDAFRMRDYCIINSFTIQTLNAFRAEDEHITLSNVLQTSSVLSTTDIDNAVTLGNCQICAFDYPTFGGIERIPSSVLEYAIEKDIRIYEAQINSFADLDDIIYKGVSGAHITIPINSY